MRFLNLRQRFSKILLVLGSSLFILSIGFYRMLEAQEQQGCFMIDSSGRTIELNQFCNSTSEEDAVENTAATEAFLRGRDLASQDQLEEALEEVNRAIELNPEMAEAYALRSLINVPTPGWEPVPGWEQRALEDARKAADIFRSRGDNTKAGWVDTHIEQLQEHIEARRNSSE